jgi:hypothetical protein
MRPETSKENGSGSRKLESSWLRKRRRAERVKRRRSDIRLNILICSIVVLLTINYSFHI